MSFSISGSIRPHWFVAVFLFGISFSTITLAFATDADGNSDSRTDANLNVVSELSGLLADADLQRCMDEIAIINGWTGPRQFTGRVDCKKRNIKSLAGIEAFSNITSLDLSINFLSDIAPVAKLQKLEVLKLGFNTVSDLRPLASLQHLKILSIGNNMVTDISPIAGLYRLQNLSLQNNLIHDISAITALTTLENLNLAVNSISDISALAQLTNLKYLSLLENNVSDVSALESLSGLRGLNLRGNKIKNIDNFTNLIKLSNINLSDNHIEARASGGVLALATLPELQHVNLSGNKQISCAALYDLIAEMKAANKIVVPATAQQGNSCSSP